MRYAAMVGAASCRTDVLTYRETPVCGGMACPLQAPVLPMAVMVNPFRAANRC